MPESLYLVRNIYNFKIMTAIEHTELKGITIKNMIVTVISTASIVVSVMSTYFGLKADIQEIKSSQETEAKINNIRIKMLEGQVTVLQAEITAIKDNKK